MILLASAGALALLAQVVILRELVAALFGVELLYVVALGAWLAGTAAGALAGRRVPAHRLVIAAALAALGAMTLVALAAVRNGAVLAGAVPGAYLAFPVQLAAIALATLPPAALCGLLFPPLVRLAAQRGLQPARAYACECAGAGVGGLLVTALFWLGASTLHVAVLTAALACLAAVRILTRRIGWLVACVAIAAALAGGAGLARWDAWDAWLLRGQYPSLLAARDTPYGRVVVTGAEGQLAVFQNGALAFDTEGTSAEAFADLAALQHPRPERALVLGGGVEGVPAALAAHGLSVVDNVEVDERADALVRALVSRAPPSGGARSPVRVIYREPRQFLDHAPAYDLILVAMPAPSSGETSRFYTREFFAICRRHLSAGGVLAIRLPAAENFWPPPLARLVSTVVAAMALEMPSISVVPGATLYAFGSASALPATADILVRRLAEQSVRPRLMTPPYLRYLYDNNRRSEIRQLTSSDGASEANRDAAPVCYRYAAMVWLSKFYPQVAAGAPRPAGRGPWVLAASTAALLAGLLWWVSRSERRVSLAFMFVMSGATMVLETVALLRYQIANGVVFVNVGWLLACFMSGMTAGAWVTGRAAAPRGARARRLGVILGLLAVSAAIAGMTRWAALAGLAGTSVMLALAGAVAGAAFGAVMRERPGDRDSWGQTRFQLLQPNPSEELKSSLTPVVYAADVAGGAVGALLATLLLVPAFGLDGTAGLIAVVGLALIPLGLTPGFARR